jgi:tetratricopeptide (TPR) repeat protein
MVAPQHTEWSQLSRIVAAAALACVVAWPASPQSPASDAQQRWQSLSRQAIDAYDTGDYPNGIALAQQALRLASQTFGNRAPQTLTSLNNLAALMRVQGRYSEAEPLYKEALQARRDVLGPRHPDTLGSLNNLAFLYQSQGRYGEAEPLYRDVLQTNREVLGKNHPNTLISCNNLGDLYGVQGRYGPARGLLALGGIDFGAAAPDAKKPSRVDGAAASDVSGAVTRASVAFHNGFPRLLASGEEAREVKEWYQRLRKDEPAEIWSGVGVSKARLLALTLPPRVLHLATHGFYLAGDPREPMLQSGVALAGANRTLPDKDANGILFALEAQGLNLEGNELVVLSACDTAQGSLDYSEGVYGLVRALRTAGARNVLVTLWKLNDGEARDFMVAFYKNWLNQVRSDPAKALRDTQLSYLKHDKLRDPRVWAPYILIE